MKIVKRSAALTVAVAALLSAAMPAVSADNYTPVAGGENNISFDKYVLMDEGANVPNTTFSYTITSAPEQEFNLSEKTIHVYAGLSPENIALSGPDVTDTPDASDADNSFTVEFKAGDAVITTLADTDYVKGFAAGKQYAKKTVNMDLSGVNFDEPGIYRYKITEEQGTEQGITYDSDSTRYLDVYVQDVNGALQVASYVLHATDGTVTIDNTTYGSDGNVVTGASDQDAGKATSDYKSQGFTNEYTSYDLVFSKDVEGNQASKDKYFEFKLTIKNADDGAVYYVSYADDSNENTTDGNADQIIDIDAALGRPNRATTKITQRKEQPTSITATGGSLEQVFYLHHGQSIVIRGLAEGTQYTIEEDPEDYLPSAAVTGDTKTDDKTGEGTDIVLSENKITDSFLKDDAAVAFTNKRDGTIPTGVILSVAAPAAIGIAVIGAIIYLLTKRRKDDDEDE